MSSSLAAQLAQRSTLDSVRLQSTKSLKNPPSFIFSPRHAPSISTADLHALASNAWDQLSNLDPSFERYHARILGDEAKTIDRSTLTKEDNDRLGQVLDKVLRALGKHMLLKPAGVVLEWLLRKFRVNDLNTTSLIALFMPYHTTPHFPSALNLIAEPTLRETAPFSLLLDARASLAPLALPDLISLLPPFTPRPTARGLLEFLLRLPLSYLEADEKVHRVLIGFWLQFVAAYVDRAGTKLPEGERAAVLSTILEVLRSSRDQPDLLIATYILLARYGLHLPFEGETLRVVVKTIVSNKARRDTGDEETDAAFITTLIVVTHLGQGPVDVGEGKKFLGGSGWKSLMKVERLCDLLIQLCNQYDAQKFMTPFLNTLAVQAVESDSVESEAEAAIISKLLLPTGESEQNSPAVLPNTIVSLLARSAVSAALAASSSQSIQPLVRVLSQVHQRWPSIWSKELSVRTSTLPANDKPKLWSLVNAVLSGGRAVANDTESPSVFLAASHPDAAVRVKDVNDVLLSADNIAASNPSFVHDTLVARLSESDASVVAAVLAPSALSILNKYVGGVDQLHALQMSLGATAPIDSVKLVLAYLASHFVVQFPELADHVVRQVFWSRLLSIKADHAQRVVAWVALKDSKLETASAWLNGVGSSYDLKLNPSNNGFAAGATRANEAVVDTLARNIAGLGREHFKVAQDYLLSSVTPIAQAGETSLLEASSHLLSSLVSARIAGIIEPKVRSRFALHVFGRITETAFGIDSFENGQVELVADLANGLPAAAVADAVVFRPNSYHTLRWVRTVLLLSVVETVRSDERIRWDWLAPQDGDHDSDLQDFVLAVYQLVHAQSVTKSAPSALASSLLRLLFGHMVVVDVLAFLASIFTSSTVPLELRVIALRDAAVYVQTQASPDLRKPVDWQVVVPAIVLALTSPDHRVRVEAMGLVSAVLQAMPMSAAHIYGREKFYGAFSGSVLQYLDVADTREYLTKIAAAKTEILMDGSYLISIHESLLDASSSKSSASHPSPSKKRTTLKVKVATFLLSHALAWRSDLETRFTFLRILSRVRDSFKADLVLPILRQVMTEYTAEERFNLSKDVDSDVVVQLSRELLQPFDGASKKWIESSADNQAFETLVKLMSLEELFGIGGALRERAFTILGASLFSVVRGEDRLDVFKRLIRLGVHQDARLAAAPLAAARAIKVDAGTVTLVLNELKLSLASPVSKGAKRGRTSLGNSSATSGSRTERVPELVVILESVDFTKLEPIPNLLLAMFDLLSSMIEVPAPAQVDVQYPGQLVLSSLSALVLHVDPNANTIITDSIRMSPVLDLMRTSTNPQTYHQALLLLAQLGPLVPDQLVHHVMPIFTFVGANVIQRDDAYSLRVVDQTLESIIPALVKSTKRKSGDREALVANLKDLLQVFADAAQHMPQHRRTKLIVRLVETLGSQDFLSAMAMLLAERDIKTADGSPLYSLVLEHFSIEVQLAAFHQIVAEVGHLLEGEPAFLTRAATVEMESEVNNAMALQIDRQLSLLATTLESRQLLGKVDAARAASLEDIDSSLTSLIRALLDLVPPPASTLPQTAKSEFVAVTNSCIRSTVHLMSTSSFSEAILWLLDQSDATIQARAFGLLRTRLPKIKSARRAEISPAVVCVVDRAHTLLSETTENRDGALETLLVIASSVYPDEDTALAKVVPYLIAMASSADNDVATRVLAINIVTKLTSRLGPRLIPLVAKIVPFAVDTLHSVAKQPTGLSAIAAPMFETLEGLFSSIPNFIGAHTDKVLQLALSPDVLVLAGTKGTAVSKARAAFLSTAAKRLPAKVLYPSIIRMHASLGSSPTASSVLGLLDVLNRALRYGKVAAIAEVYRSIFKLFLAIFDLRRLQPSSLLIEILDRIEDTGLGAFVQFILKLNEQTFRPLFLRTYDWAAIDLVEEGEVALIPRRIVLYKLMDRLLTQLRSIVVPYFSFMLDQTTALLVAFARGDHQDVALWTAVTSALTKSIDYDEGNFWTPLRLGKLSTPVADQVLVSRQVLPPGLVKSHYEPLLSQYSLRLVAHERLLKQFNMSLLMHTRSDDLCVKRAAVEALEQVWVALADGMLGFVPETTPFLSETLEESEGGVERATRSLITRIEEHLGEPLDSFLDA